MYPLSYFLRGKIDNMQDIRIERWAHTLIHYSLSVKAGETIAIHATPLAAPLVEAVYREILRTGAHPVPLIDLENLEEILLRQGSDAQLTKISPVSSALVDWLVGHKQVHIKGEQTDLTLSIQDRVFINSDGKRNFPSGEFFTGPVENSANGVIQFDIPASYDGRTIEGVRLVFREGKVVEASARHGQDYLEHMLDMDAGARYLGEFAFGNNPRVDRSMKNVLFDEKMGGTVHLALGASYPETGGVNSSALHWDMVCDLRHNGEVWVDDALFLKDGKIQV